MFEELASSEHLKHEEDSTDSRLSNQTNRYIKHVSKKYIKTVFIQLKSNSTSFSFMFFLSIELSFKLHKHY